MVKIEYGNGVGDGGDSERLFTNFKLNLSNN